MEVSKVHPVTTKVSSFLLFYWFVNVLLFSPNVSVLRLLFMSTLPAAGWDFFKTAGT